MLACVASAVTWFATAGRRASNALPPAAERADFSRLDEPRARSGAAPSGAARTSVPSEESAAQAGKSAVSGTSKAPPVLSLDAPPLMDAAGTVDTTVTLTGAKLPAPRPVDPEVAKELSSSTHLYCKFEEGSSGLANGDTMKPGGASFGGGPVTLEVLDLAAGRAQMLGDAGGASSPTGTSAMRVTATEGTLNFSGITPLNEIVLTTVFATKSSAGRFTAVRSQHGMIPPHVSAQFYGSCEGDGKK